MKLKIKHFDNNLLIYAIYIVKNRLLLTNKYLIKGRIKVCGNKEYLYLYYDINVDKNTLEKYSFYEKNYFNTYVSEENNSLYIICKFNIPDNIKWYINIIYNQDVNILGKYNMIDIIEYWKEYSNTILEHEKTRTARESSPGLFLLFSIYYFIFIVSTFTIRIIILFV